MSETMTAAQLRAAADLIGDRARWRRRAYATDVAGRVVSPTSSRAVCWCAAGAVARQAVGIAIDLTDALDALDPERRSLTLINEREGHAAAVAELRRLADLAEAREGTVVA